MEPKITITKNAARRSRAALTLVEMMVSVGIGSVLMAVIATFILYYAHSFAATANYADLELSSRHALDTISTAVRETHGFSYYSPWRVELIDTNGSPLILSYSPDDQTLYMTKQGVTTEILTHCTDCTFNPKQRNPQANKWDQFDTLTNSLDTFKVLKVGWVCSRNLFGTSLLNTEVMQTTRIVIRAN